MSATLEAVSKAKAHTTYRLADGTRVAGTTTVLAVLAKPALVKWANQIGLQGVEVGKYVDALADIGTLAHALITHDLGGPAPDLAAYSPEAIDKAENAFIKYLDWRKQHNVEPVFVERPLVSEKFRYGGTLDVYAHIDGAPAIIDIKTSKRIYSEHIHQVAAYRQLAVENGFDVDHVRILQVGRTDDEGFTERVVSLAELRRHWQIFRCCLTIYRLQTELKEE
ncbi:MAG: hypothetical protein AB1760_00125 [Pseudomonadota bacterium]